MKQVEQVDTNPSASSVGRDRRNRRRVALWAFAWALAFCAATWGTQKGGWSRGIIALAVAGTAALGLATVLAYRSFLSGADELRRKIEVEALALAFGVGVFGGLAVWLLALSGILQLEAFAYLFAGMILTHRFGVFLGRRRYA